MRERERDVALRFADRFALGPLLISIHFICAFLGSGTLAFLSNCNTVKPLCIQLRQMPLERLIQL